MSETTAPKTSTQYRAAIYFAVATMHFYRDSLKPIQPGETLGDYAQANDAVIQQVIKEAKSDIGYELSSEQIGRAIHAYLAPPSPLPGLQGASLQEAIGPSQS